jgi:hypothetical protein
MYHESLAMANKVGESS